jgi:PTS system ascorbate-specific IIA component
MNTGLLLIAHAPLASALRAAVLHVFPDAGQGLLALDVPPNEPPEVTMAAAAALLAQLGTPNTLVLTDVFGATPCNVAQRVVDGVHSRLIAGVNLPMLLRTMNYRQEALDVLVTRALAGGTQSIMQRKNHDQQHHDHSQ